MNRLSERDICTKYITPALTKAGWDLLNQIREEVSFTKGRVIVRGKIHNRGKQKRADYRLLQMLSERELRDLGIGRSQIKEIIYGEESNGKAA